MKRAVAVPKRSELTLEQALGGLAVGGAAVLLAYLASNGRLDRDALAGLFAGILAAVAGGAVWRVGARWADGAGRGASAARTLGAVPLLPWLAGWPLAVQGALDPLAHAQLIGSRGIVAGYLGAWTLAGLAGLALWLWAIPASGVPQMLRRPPAPFGPPEAVWIAVPLLALAAAAYWNGAILDPLQFRGFPDYVTQMGGARRLLAGELPYNPTIRVWTDVNLPPITLLLLFAPFAAFSELGGKLAYFLVNQLTFFAALATLLFIARPPARLIRPLLWGSAVAALALTFEPWHDSLRLGQQNGIVLLCLALCLAAVLVRRDVLAGVALAAALIGKPSSALLGLYFLFGRRWRVVVGAAFAGVAAFLITLPWTGWDTWRFYLLEKAPQILAGTPQQSNVALLALHARLFLPPEALSSFDAMPDLPPAQTLTRVAQLLGVLALWRLTGSPLKASVPVGPDHDASARRLTAHLELAVALVLSLSLVGHAWQSYVTWLIVAFVPLADPRAWAGLPDGARWLIGALAVAAYAGIAINDVALYRVVGNNSGAAAVFASLPNVMLLVLAFSLALLRAASRQPGAPLKDGRPVVLSVPAPG